MLTYHYRCTRCTHELTARKSIKDPPLRDCPACGTSSLETVLHAATVIDATPRTLGAQADRNHARAGAYEREAKHRDIELAGQRARAGRLPDGMTSIRNPNPGGTWWRPGEKQVKPELVRADPRAKKRYIEEGKI